MFSKRFLMLVDALAAIGITVSAWQLPVGYYAALTFFVICYGLANYHHGKRD